MKTQDLELIMPLRAGMDALIDMWWNCTQIYLGSLNW